MAALEGAPILAIAKLIGDASAPRPNVTSTGDKVTVVTRSGSMSKSDTIECDSVYNATVAPTDLFSDVFTPIVSALLEGVNSLLFVTGNEERGRQQLFDGSAGSASGFKTLTGAVSHAAHAIFEMLGQKRVALGQASGYSEPASADVFEVSVYASYAAIGDDTLFDTLDNVGTASTLSSDAELEIVEDDAEGVYVRGLTTFGPVSESDGLSQLLDIGHKRYYEKTRALAAETSKPVFVSRVVRITVNQTIRMPGTPVNALRSHFFLVDVAGLETLSALRNPSLHGLGPTTTAVAMRSVAAMLAESRRGHAPAFAASTASRFGVSSTAENPTVALTRDSVDRPVLEAFPELNDNPVASVFAVCNLTKLLSDCLGGNSLAVALCTIATAGVTSDATLAVLEVLNQFRKGQCYPIVASTSARGLLRNYRKSIRHLRNISLELLHRNKQLQLAPATAPGEAERHLKRDKASAERNHVSSVIRAARADVGDEGTVNTREAAFGATEQQVAELALKYEERLVELSRQLLDAELENTVLREGIKADKRDIVVRMAELQQENLMLSEEAKDLGQAYDRMKTEFDDTVVELISMQSNAKAKAKDARAMRERAAFLEQQVEMMQSQLRDMADRSPHFYPTVAPAIKDDSFFRQQSALLQICMRLRRRVAELTTDSSEFERMARTNLSLEMLVADAPAESSGILPDSAFVEADGKPVPYPEMTNRLHKCSQQNTRMRSALEQAAQHIRECHDQIKRMQNGRFAATGESPDSELARLRAKVDTYKAHLVKARDALVAAKTAKEARDKPYNVLSDTKDTELYRAELLKLQERCGKLSSDNERMRQALTSAVESMAVRPSDSSLPTLLVESERKLATILVENTDLQEQVSSLRDQYDATVSRFEKVIAALRQDLDRSRSIIAQVTSAKASLGTSTAGRNSS